MVATTEHLRITGAGALDLVRGHVDYRFKPRFVEPPKGLGIKELEGEIKGLEQGLKGLFGRWSLPLSYSLPKRLSKGHLEK